LVVHCSIAAQPPWEDAPAQLELNYDPLAQPEPAIEFDQRVQFERFEHLLGLAQLLMDDLTVVKRNIVDPAAEG